MEALSLLELIYVREISKIWNEKTEVKPALVYNCESTWADAKLAAPKPTDPQSREERVAFSSVLSLKPFACVPALSQCKRVIHGGVLCKCERHFNSVSFVAVENLPWDRRRLGCSSDEKSFTSDGLQREGKQSQLSVCEGTTLHRLQQCHHHENILSPTAILHPGLSGSDLIFAPASATIVFCHLRKRGNVKQKNDWTRLVPLKSKEKISCSVHIANNIYL